MTISSFEAEGLYEVVCACAYSVPITMSRMTIRKGTHELGGGFTCLSSQVCYIRGYLTGKGWFPR